MTDACCGRCHFYRDLRHGQATLEGEGACRRFPPLGKPAVHPRVTMSQWCGEFSSSLVAEVERVINTQRREGVTYPCALGIPFDMRRELRSLGAQYIRLDASGRERYRNVILVPHKELRELVPLYADEAWPEWARAGQ